MPARRSRAAFRLLTEGCSIIVLCVGVIGLGATEIVEEAAEARSDLVKDECI